MKSAAFCDVRYCGSAAKVVGGDVVIALPPPMSDDELRLLWSTSDFIYIDLHGRPDFPQCLFADGEKVLMVEQFEGLPGGRVVFATTCHMPGTRFVDALAENYLVLGSGPNYGSRERVTGAPLLAMWMRKFLLLGMEPENALKLSKLRLVLSSWRKGDRDALTFSIALPRQGGGYV
jgi:hypothetical protein